MRHFSISSRLIFFALLIFAGSAFADISRDQNLMRTLSSTFSHGEKIDLIDSAVENAIYASASHESAILFANIRGLSCKRVPKRCLVVKQWMKNACGPYFQNYREFFEEMWAPVLEAVATERQALKIWADVQSCSSKPSFGQLSVLSSLLELAGDKSWGQLSSSIFSWSNQNLKLPPDENLNGSLSLMLKVLKSYDAVKPKPTSRMVSVGEIGLRWVEVAKSSQLDHQDVKSWVNMVSGVFIEAGSYSRELRLSRVFDPIIKQTTKGLQISMLIKDFCRASQEVGKPERCKALIVRVYADRPDFEMAVLLGRNALEQGNYKEANEVFNSLLNRRDRSPYWSAWLPYNVALSEIYLGNLSEAEKSLEKHELLSERTPDGDKLASASLRAKLMRYKKNYKEAWVVMNPYVESLQGKYYGPSREKMSFEMEHLLNAVGLKDEDKIRQFIASIKLGFFGDSSEDFNKLAVEIVEKKLAKEDYATELTKLGKIKGSLNPQFVDFKQAIESE